MTVKAEIYGEVCCDLCGEIIHNHFEVCPVCHRRNAATGTYHNMDEDGGDETVTCAECGTEFRKVSSGTWYGYDEDLELEIVILGKGVQAPETKDPAADAP